MAPSVARSRQTVWLSEKPPVSKTGGCRFESCRPCWSPCRLACAGAWATVRSMSDTLRLTITYDEPDEDGWIVARLVQVPGAISQGRTREEARENVIDALRLMLAPDDDADVDRSEPLELTFAE